MAVASNKALSDICQVIDRTVDVEKIYLFGSFAYGTPHADNPAGYHRISGQCVPSTADLRFFGTKDRTGRGASI